MRRTQPVPLGIIPKLLIGAGLLGALGAMGAAALDPGTNQTEIKSTYENLDPDHLKKVEAWRAEQAERLRVKYQ